MTNTDRAEIDKACMKAQLRDKCINAIKNRKAELGLPNAMTGFGMEEAISVIKKVFDDD